MPTITATVSSPVRRSFRVEQIAGMFDLPLAEKSCERFTAELPEMKDHWQIGLIVGPSGSGKTTIARQAFGEALCGRRPWPEDAAVIDGFGAASTREITRTLTAVGLSSPPAWVKPYHVLSGGEQFRCDLARALVDAGDDGLVVFDEFTSVVDRTVAKVSAAAVSRAIRGGHVRRRFVAVSCHRDVTAWLEPDWIVEMPLGRLARGCLRRPSIRLAVVRCRHTAWPLFARHHYLGGGVAAAAQCFMAIWEDHPVAFCALVGAYGHKGRKRISRIVTLPDYQGLGIGVRLMEHVCRDERSRGVRVNITASHPSIIAHCRGSEHWRAVNVSRFGHRRSKLTVQKAARISAGRSVVSFEFVGP